MSAGQVFGVYFARNILRISVNAYLLVQTSFTRYPLFSLLIASIISSTAGVLHIALKSACNVMHLICACSNFSTNPVKSCSWQHTHILTDGFFGTSLQFSHLHHHIPPSRFSGSSSGSWGSWSPSSWTGAASSSGSACCCAAAFCSRAILRCRISSCV